MMITTEEAEARCQELLDHCHGQPAKVSWPHRVLHDAVATIRTLAAERDKLSKALAGALANLADASRARGEAEGKLAASEMAGVVEGWKERAERAEAKVESLQTHIEGTAKDTQTALRTLAAERDIANKQIYGLAEERERWKERAERAEQRLGDLLAVIHRDGGQFWAVHGDEAAVNKAHHAWATLITRAERAEAEAERMREALVEMTDICHQCLFKYILIRGRYVDRKEAVARARAALEGGDNAANEKPRQP